MAVGPQESALAPRFSRVVSVLIVIICVLTEVSLVSYGHVEVLLRATPAVAFVAFGAYALFWAPLVRVDSGAIEILNPLRTFRISWTAIRDITTRWSLTVVTGGGAYTAWSAPSEGPWASLGRLNRDVFGRPSLGAADRTKRPGEALGVPSIITTQWENYRDSGAEESVAVSWHRATVVTLVALAVLTILGIAWP